MPSSVHSSYSLATVPDPYVLEGLSRKNLTKPVPARAADKVIAAALTTSFGTSVCGEATMESCVLLLDDCDGAPIETVFIGFAALLAPDTPSTEGFVVNPSTWQDAASIEINEIESFIFDYQFSTCY